MYETSLTIKDNSSNGTLREHIIKSEMNTHVHFSEHQYLSTLFLKITSRNKYLAF